VVEPQEKVAEMVARYRYPYPVIADPDHTISDAYGVYDLLGDGRATPSVFIVDESGAVVWAYVGRHSYDRPPTQRILDELP
jgi:alkyl hydroperoxide reductase subunit AhpC